MKKTLKWVYFERDGYSRIEIDYRELPFLIFMLTEHRGFELTDEHLAELVLKGRLEGPVSRHGEPVNIVIEPQML